MNAKLLLLSCAIALCGCDKLGDKVMSSLPDPSAAQAKAAQEAYDALREDNAKQFYAHLSPELKAEFMQNEKELHKISQSLPKEHYTRKNIVAKHIENGTDKPSRYQLTYEYGYSNKNLVQYDVSFDKPGGSDKIIDLNVSIFGEKN